MSKKTFKSMIADTSGLPKDVVFGFPIVNIIGQTEAYIENYRGILEYTDRLIRIQTKHGKIHVNGKTLQIEHYGNEEMKITGHIESIEFLEGGT